ncbi:hypothetical protein K4L02_14495 [Phaeobacter inhibens]|uniref:hypothetical protein n=1 Tax=Phaeobacter inhibens TaxID=221822 RepID=UPI0021A6A2EA|nr:hypothetical protein [Phaeobacter inhibens]UWR63940.1 hypothetical protein K4L02_14495 [Phaeobacter inhibens]UWR95509.1 hypothetical protein K4K99_14190 [Phaeobacter inhibens]UWR99532.1 hypothetical protein K4L03_14140 [Phaeobacter inhibens]UWS03425.1 hypothetical protein K4K94_14115 [Phaeobacter inhibens]
MALCTSLVGAEGTRIPGAAILSPRDGDIVASPIAVDLRVPAEGAYHFYVDGDPAGPEGLPMGDVRLTLDVPTGIHELDVRQMGAALSGQAITVLVDRITLPDDKNCLTCGGSRRP